MPLIWRGMKGEGDKPQIGPGGILLGVRVGPGQNDDLNVDALGHVHPGQGGMSVSPSLDALPPHRLPRRLRDAFPVQFSKARGPNVLFCWSMGAGAFIAAQVAERLRLRLDPDNSEKHGFVEPADKMILADYEAALAATRDEWLKWKE